MKCFRVLPARQALHFQGAFEHWTVCSDLSNVPSSRNRRIGRFCIFRHFKADAEVDVPDRAQQNLCRLCRMAPKPVPYTVGKLSTATAKSLAAGSIQAIASRMSACCWRRSCQYHTGS